MPLVSVDNELATLLAGRSGSYGWTAYSGNPIMAAAAGSVGDGNAFMDVFYDGSLFHAFTTVDGPNYGIWHYTSTDGLTGWVGDTGNPVIPLGTGGTFDANQVGTPTAWLENGVVNVLYKGFSNGAAVAKIGLATAPIGGGANLNFTKNAGNPVADNTGANIYVSQGGIEPGPGRVIKVGATYFMFVSALGNSTQGNGATRAVGVMSATNPAGPWSWAAATTNANDPIFSDGSLCNSVWTDGTYYYSLNCHMRNYNDSMTFHLWRSTDVRFPYYNRTKLGVFRDIGNAAWESLVLDTPTVFTDTIQRNSFNATGGMPRIYYSGSNGTIFLPGALIPSLVSHPVPLDSQRPTPFGQWVQTTVAASQTNVQLPHGDGQNYVIVPSGGSITRIAVNTSAAITAGSLTATVTFGTSPTGGSRPTFSITLPGTRQSTSQAMASLPEGQWHVGPGDPIGVQLTTSAGFLPAGSMTVAIAVAGIFD